MPNEEELMPEEIKVQDIEFRMAREVVALLDKMGGENWTPEELESFARSAVTLTSVVLQIEATRMPIGRRS